MSNVTGAKITLPDGTVFEFRGNLSIQVEHNQEYLLSGFSTPIAYVERLAEKASTDTIKTPLASGYVGGGGTRVFEIAADNWEGETNQFGPANNDDSVDEKLAVFENELAQANVDSLNPATLEFGPYSSTSSRYDPIPVVFPQLSPTVDFGEGPSIFRSRFTAAETIDLGQAIDDSISADFRLTPSDASTPRIPIPADTLGFGGRGTGRQQQGNDAAASALVDTNGSGSSPTHRPTKILPGEVRLRGAFRGDGAAGLADTLRADFLSNSDVDAVDLTAPGRSGPTPLTGTYVLGPESSIDPLTPQIEDGIYAFDLDLREQA